MGGLRDALEGRLAAHVSSTTMIAFGDFYWERDWTIERLMELEPAVQLDAKSSSRRAVLQRVRGEVRYWLTTQRAPYLDDDSTEHELGAVRSIEDAIALCDEFLIGERSVADLETKRSTGARP